MKFFVLTLTLCLWANPEILSASEKETFVTEMNFDSDSIDGKVKAPSGFFLRGRSKQELNRMVQMRKSFKNKLRNSKSAVKSISK